MTEKANSGSGEASEKIGLHNLSPAPGLARGIASDSAAVRAPAQVRRRARDTRVSRRARAITVRAAASRTSRAARCRSRVVCRSAASRIHSVWNLRSFASTTSSSSAGRRSRASRCVEAGSDQVEQGSGQGAGER